MPQIQLSIAGSPRTLDTDAATFTADLTTALADVRAEGETAAAARLAHATAAHGLLVGECVRLRQAAALARSETFDAAAETAYLSGLPADRLQMEWERTTKDVPAPAPATTPTTPDAPSGDAWAQGTVKAD